jgi:serine/threonine-protein kinase RsbT
MTPSASEDDVQTIPILIESDVVVVRQAVRAATVRLGFRLIKQTKLVTAASELGRNTLIHGGGGEATVEVCRDDKARVRLTFSDRGKGIPDIEQAMSDGFTTGVGLGMGLGGSKRLVDVFEITSKVNEGTTVRVEMSE